MKKQYSGWRSRSVALALEPRLMFDGAMAIDVQEQTDWSPAAAEREDAATITPTSFAGRDTLTPSKVHQLYIIDSRLAGDAGLLAALPADATLYIVPAQADALTAITHAIADAAQNGPLDAVHIVSHGHQGSLTIGADDVDVAMLDQNETLLASWAARLSASADILLYGCDIGAGADGAALLTRLATLTAADIAASNNATGNAARGGDWRLEVTTGTIEAASLTASAYSGLLGSPPTITDTVTQPRTTAEDTPLTISGVSVADGDSNSPTMRASLTITAGRISLAGAGWTIVGGADNSASVSISGSLAAINSALNGMVFTPAGNVNGNNASPSIVLSVSDLSNSDGPATLTINPVVSPVNDIPAVAVGSSLVVNEGGSASYAASSALGSEGFTQSQLGLSDVDNSAVQTIAKIAGLPSHGTLKIDSTPVALGATISLADIHRLSYTHDGSQVGASGADDVFMLTYDDGAGGLLTDQLVTVHINPVNQAPAVAATITVIEGESNVRLDSNGALPALIGGNRGAITVVDADDSTHSYQITSLPTHGTLYYNGSPIAAATPLAPFAVADLTLLTYSHDGSETTSDSFDFTVTDAGGGAGTPATTSATANLVIYPNDDDPLLTINVPQTLSGSTLTVTNTMLQVGDVDSPPINLTYTLTAVPDPALGYFMLGGQLLIAGAGFTQADIDAGRLVYVSHTPATGAARTDSISFTVKDSGQRILPDARDGGIYDTSAQNSPLTVNTFNVVVPTTEPADGNPVPLPLAINTAPTPGGTQHLDIIESATATLTSGLLGMLDATDAEQTASELVYRLHALPTSGAVTLNGIRLLINQTFTQDDVDNGRVAFVHDGNEDFVDQFEYTVSDGKLVSTLQTFTLSITPQNDTPTATTTMAFVAEGQSIALLPSNIDLSDRDNTLSDLTPETGYAIDQALSFRISALPTHGSLTLDGVAATVGTVVTAAQLAAGKLVYQHDDTEQYSDQIKLVPIDDAGVVGGLISATNQSSEGAEVTLSIGIYPINDAPAYFHKSQLIASEAGAIEEGATAVIGGASGYTTVNGVSGSGVPTAAAGAHLVFGDNDNSSIQRQYRITAAPTTGQLLLNGSGLGVGSVFTQDDLDNGRISYKHNGSETYSDSFSYVVSDGDFIVNDSQTFTQGSVPTASTYLIEITPRNDVPTLNVPSQVNAFAAGGGTTAVAGISIADPDLANGLSTGETDFIRVEVQVLDSGNVLVGAAQLGYTASDPSGGLAYVAGKGSNSLIIQGSKAEVDAAIGSLTIAFSADADASNYKIRVTVDDRLYDSGGVLTSGANGGPAPLNADGTAIDASNNRVSKDIVLYASNSNDPPTLSNPTAYSVNEDATLTLNGFTLSDVDSFGQNVTLTVRLYSDAGHSTLANAATQGLLTIGTTTGLASSSGSGSNTVTLSGPIDKVQDALNALTLSPAANFNNGPLYLETTVVDFNHAGGSQTATVDNTVTVVPVNDAPTLSVPGNQTMASGLSLPLPASFAVGDAVDIAQGANDYVEVTVAATQGGVAYGALTAVASGAAVVDNNGTATLVVKGNVADVTATLNAMNYAPTDANVDQTILITTTVDDLQNGQEITGVGGNNTTQKTFTINISGTNDAPSVTAPATASVNEDSSSNLLAGLSISDSDDFGNSEKVTLDLGPTPKGTLTLGTITGLTFSTGDGTADSKMVFAGTKAAINTALATLRFTPTANLNTVGGGNEQTLTITVDDQGNTGFGGALTDSENVLITIVPVNDAPTRTVASTSLGSFAEDTSPAGSTVSAVFTAAFSDATDTQSGGSTANGLAGVAIVGNAATVAQGNWQYDSGSGWTNLPASPSLTTPFLLKASDQIRFLPAANWNGTPGQLTVRLIDDSAGAVTTGSGPNLSGAATGGTTAYSSSANAVTLAVTVTPVNDAPIASGSLTLAAINEDSAAPVGATLASLASGHYSDVTDTVSGGSSATALGGVAIVGNGADPVTQGVWKYSTDNGVSWTAVPAATSDSSALVLPSSAKIAFFPIADYAGTPGGLSVRLADSAQAFAASSDLSALLGGSNTWSAAAIPLSTTVNPVNDLPSISGLSGTPALIEQQATPVRLDADGAASVADTELNVSVSGWNGATLSVQRSGTASASDLFSFVDASGSTGDNSGVELSGANLLVDGVSIGTVSNSGGTLLMTFNSSATASQVALAMGAVAYRNTSDTPPATVQINFLLNDQNSLTGGSGTAGTGQNQGSGGMLTALASINVAITRVNDAPGISALDAVRSGNYVENGTAVQIDANAVLSDPELDATNWNKATLTVARSGGANTDDVFGAIGSVSFSGSGSGNVLVSGTVVGTYTQSGGQLAITFNGSATASRADTVLQGLTYRNASEDPPASVTLSVSVNDQNPTTGGSGTAGTGVDQGTGGRLLASSDIVINITRLGDAPVISAAPPAVSYIEQGTAVTVDGALTLSDVDDTTMSSASLSIGSFVAGDTLSVDTGSTGIVANYNPATGVLTLSGAASTADYQAVLRSLTFASSSDDPTVDSSASSRTISYSVTDGNSDGAGAQTTSSTRSVNLTPVNDAPTLAGAGHNRIYIENASAIALEPALGLSDVDDTQLVSATVRIASGLIAGDRLNFTDQSGISGVYTAATGTLTLSGMASLAAYQTALRSITFDSTSDDPGNGTRTIEWTVRDANSDAAPNGQQASAVVTTTIDVVPVNDDPLAQPDSNSVAKTAVVPISGTVLANDNDVDGAPLVVSALGGGTLDTPLVRPSGSLTLHADGSYSFAVNPADPTVAALGAGQTVNETYTYTVSDGHGGTANATLTITITGSNNAPVALADANAINEGTASLTIAAASGVLNNDSDLNADPLLVSGVVAGADQPLADCVAVSGAGTSVSGVYGSLFLAPDGSYIYTLDNANPTVGALAVGETLSDSFTYAISDGKGGTATANVVITILGTNDTPVAVNDSSSLPANAPNVVGNALANDSDPDTTDTLTVSAVNGLPGNVGTPIVGTYGSLTLNADGSYTFTPNGTTSQALAAGQTASDSFIYSIDDGHGGTDSATVTITLSGVNDVPTAQPDSNTLSEDQATASGNVLSGGRISGSGEPSTVAGSVDSDPDTGDSLQVIALHNANGLAGSPGAPLAGDFGQLTLNADGSYSYALDSANPLVQALTAGETRQEIFSYQISDGKGGTAWTTLTIDVVGQNDPPLANDDAYATVDTAGLPGGTPIAGNVLANDSDPDAADLLTVSAVSGGSVGGPTSGTFGTLTLNADGTFTYNVDQTNPVIQTLQSGESRAETFTYTISDGNGSTSTATITITIYGTNDAPYAGNDENQVSEEQTQASGNVISGSQTTGSGVTSSVASAQDVDPDGDPLTVTTVRRADPALPYGAVGASYAGDFGTLTLNADGSYIYLLDNGNAEVQALKTGETRTDVFVYTINDGRGIDVEATLTLVITGVNDLPVAQPDSNHLVEDTASPATGNVLPNDSDIDHGAVLTVSGVVAGSAASAPIGSVGSAVAGHYGTLTLNADGSYSYQLDNGNPLVQALSVGTTVTDIFTYAISDGEGGTAYTTLTLTISGQNDAPLAQADSHTLNAGDNAVSGDLTPGTVGQDSDTDDDPLTVVSFTNADGASGVVNGGLLDGHYGSLQVADDGSYSYQLDNANATLLALHAGETISESFTYTINDGHGGYSTSTLTLTISGRNDPPVAVNDGPLTSNEDTPLNNLAVLPNDHDIDGDPLTVTAATSPQGTVLINPDGTLDFTPTADFNGPATITYTISDGHGGTSTATVTINVAPVNDPPVAVNDGPLNTNEDTPLNNIAVLPNDSDIDGDPLTVTAATSPQGTVLINPDGTLDFTPTADFNGPATITYTISDGHGGTSTATVTINVAPVNDPPVAVNDGPLSTNEDTPLNNIAVLPNDSDIDGDPLTVTAATSPQGTVTINPDGTLNFTPATDFNGPATITYTISDGHGGTSTATVTINVAPVNDPPVAVNDGPLTSNEDTPLNNIAVLPNDSDIDGDPLTVTAATSPQGTVTINPDGTLNFTPATDFNGPATITYTISDGHGGTSTATVTINVAPVNDPPVAVNDGPLNTNEDTPLNNIAVLPNDSDIDGDPLTVTAATSPQGTVTINPDGTLNFTPATDFNGPATITYTISDGHGGTSTATVTINVAPVNDPPVAVNDGPLTSNEDTPLNNIAVLPNDSDIDGDPLTVTAATSPQGTVTINPDGTLNFTPATDFNGPATITYTISDGHGGTSTATVTINVAPVNDPPVAVNDGPLNTNEDTPLNNIAVLPNDSDIDGDPLTVTAATSPQGTVTINPDGTLNFTPATDFNGPATITYTISDGHGGTSTATVTINVAPVNDPPVAVNDGPLSTNEDTPLNNIAVLPNDSDIDGDPLTVTAATSPQGTVTINPDGTLNFTPATDFNGPATITYTISDGHGGTSTATVTINVAPVNDPPVAVNDGPLNTNEDTPLNNIAVLPNDSDIDGDPLTVTAATSPQGTVTINPDGTLDFTPTADFNGPATITYTISDGHGGTSTATVTINVAPVNDPPVAVNDGPLSTNEDTPLNNIAVLPNDSDIDGDPLTVTAATSPQGTVTINPDGTLNFTPATDFNGPATITYTISDGHGGTSTATVTINVAPVNDPPVAVNDGPLNTNEDTPLNNIAVLPNDSDIDGDPLTVTAATSPQGTVTINPDGTLNFTPATDFNGPATITYTISDGHGGTSTATVTINVAPVNDPPVAVNDGPLNTNEDTPLNNIAVLPNDSDIDGDPLTVTAATSPQGTVTINPDGTLNFTPATDFNGPATITYTISDGHGGTSTATVTINVAPVNDPPVAVNDGPLTSNEDTPLNNIAVLPNDSDIDGDPLTVTAATSPQGTVTINPDGTLNFTPATDFNGPATITYTISDGHGGTSTATVTINVAPVNDPPVAVNDGPLTSNEDTPLNNIAVLPNDSDIDGDPLTVTAATSPQGTVTINPDGTLNFTPATDFNGPATITYTISDGHGGTSTATVTINVAPVNDPPVAVNDGPLSTNEDTPLNNIAVLPNDSDIDGDPLTVTAATSPQGTVTINPDGTLNFTPATDFNGPATITYTISDGHGGTSTATVTINVAPVNDPPVAVNDGPLNTNEDTPLNNIAVLPNDSDIDGDPLTVTAATSPQGTVTINPDGTLNFTPATDFNGPATITYTISDGHGGTSTATVTINVAPVNDPPVAVNDGPLSTNEDTPLNNIAVLPNDSDIDGDPLTVTAATSPQGTVTINPDGTLNFTPSADFNGPATITYTISDGHGGTSTATVTINVAPVNDPPVATNDQGNSPDGQPVTLSPLANDTDREGDALTITHINGVNITPGGSVDLATGTVTLNANGTLTFTPKPGVQGDISFDYAVADGHGGTSTATITLTVVPANDVRPPENDLIPTPANFLFGDQGGDPSAFREGDIFTAMPRLPIPFQPAIFVNQEVEASHAERLAMDRLGFSDPRVVRYGEIESRSLAAGLGFDPALFVQHAVRASQAESAFLDHVVFGRRSRINLSSDWRIQAPELMQADPLQAAPNDNQTDNRDDVAQAREPAEPPPLAVTRVATVDAEPGATPQAAPSFSEQLRRAAARTPTAAAKPTTFDRS